MTFAGNSGLQRNQPTDPPTGELTASDPFVDVGDARVFGLRRCASQSARRRGGRSMMVGSDHATLADDKTLLVSLLWARGRDRSTGQDPGWKAFYPLRLPGLGLGQAIGSPSLKRLHLFPWKTWAPNVPTQARRPASSTRPISCR